MTTLYLRNVPEDLDAALKAEAEAQGVSKNRRAIVALRRGMGMDQIERAELIGRIREGRRRIDTDVSDLIREDRPAGGA